MDLRPTRNIRPFPKFSKPKLEGVFSVDASRNYEDSFRNLKYLNIPSKVHFDLNEGDNFYVDKPASAESEQITQLLTFILLHKEMMTRQHAPDFVCFRGLLRLIMSTPYEAREPWIVLATKFKNTIYLCAEETQLKKAEKLRRTAKDVKFMRYGFKFESHILSDHPSKAPPGNSQPVIEAEEFCAMYSSEIDGKKILYGAEMDGVISETPCTNLEELRKLPMVEVKVKRRETNERQLINFYRFKSRNWWLQSFLVGIESIFVGIRSDEGIVEEVKKVSIKELSDEAKRNDYWHATVAVNFLNDFLRKVAHDMKAIDDPLTVYRYQYDTTRSDFVTQHKVDGNKYSFLTPEYISSINSL
jgi:RAT1-interacting protein